MKKLFKIKYLFNFFNLSECIINPFIAKNNYRENDFHFNDNIFDVETDTNFIGYYQSEKYFSHCKDIVKKEFSKNIYLIGDVTSGMSNQLIMDLFDDPDIANIKELNILMIDDHPMIIEGYKKVLLTNKEVKLNITTANNCDEAIFDIQKAKRVAIDFVDENGSARVLTFTDMSKLLLENLKETELHLYFYEDMKSTIPQEDEMKWNAFLHPYYHISIS